MVTSLVTNKLETIILLLVPLLALALLAKKYRLSLREVLRETSLREIKKRLLLREVVREMFLREKKGYFSADIVADKNLLLLRTLLRTLSLRTKKPVLVRSYVLRNFQWIPAWIPVQWIPINKGISKQIHPYFLHPHF